ncbi:hypothetical protein, partial [Coxiella burnetii]
QQQCKETCNNPATTPMPERTQ